MPSTAYCRVLCVDDDADACEMISALLKYSNIEARCVQSAEEALRLIKTDTFDVYLLDSWLPGVNGFELCRRIRGFDSSTPIVFYSGAAFPTDKQKAIEAGANAYLIKPNVDRLVETIMHFGKGANERCRPTISPEAADRAGTEVNPARDEATPVVLSVS
ncbi:MAG: response regulator transcription factor [Pyrinomonadaceae bacterium]